MGLRPARQRSCGPARYRPRAQSSRFSWTVQSRDRRLPWRGPHSRGASATSSTITPIPCEPRNRAVVEGRLSVVSVGAHQDDELGCLGTLIRYRSQGGRITTVSLSNGDKGGQHDPSTPHAVVAQTRIDEATRMVAELGGTYFCLGLEDGFVYDSREMRLGLTQI